MKTGRPEKICQKHIDYLGEYIDKCGDEYEQVVKSHSESARGESISYEYRLNCELPSYAGYLIYLCKKEREEKLKYGTLRINKSTITDWCNKGREAGQTNELYIMFSNTIEEMSILQEKMLLNGGISDKYSASISKLVLATNHGYADKEKKEVSGSLDLGEFFKNKPKDNLIG